MLSTTLSLNNNAKSICSLLDLSSGISFSTQGNGFDRVGRVLGDYLTETIKNNDILLNLFSKQTLAYAKRNKKIPSGLYFDFDTQVKRSNGSIMQIALTKAIVSKKWDIEGAMCGQEGVFDLATMVGLHFSETYKLVRNQHQVNGYILNTVENGLLYKEMLKC